MELAQESLAGRTAIIHMSALSQTELYGDAVTAPLSLSLDKLNQRKKHLSLCSPVEMFERIWYFFDTGLVAYLTKYSSPEILQNGAINGAVLENYTVAEIRKTWLNDAKESLMHYYRDKDTNEIDLVIESDGELHPLEIKKSINPGTELTSAFRILDKGSVPRGTGAILCLRETLSVIDRITFILPIWMV